MYRLDLALHRAIVHAVNGTTPDEDRTADRSVDQVQGSSKETLGPPPETIHLHCPPPRSSPVDDINTFHEVLVCGAPTPSTF
ncbi:hypothetical protein NDU88_007306 [Pleurodeles waltl]|uniref:Uncharacterized protein n=1 Tax=Pleurodeles waltl TaxID=8319 RepID=A0AAV7PNY7_PLEWA|nr:hypothetical protein NDU88_007306 [Pleurodeles waltl]